MAAGQEDALAQFAARADGRPVVVGHRARMQQHAVGHADLAHVVEVRRQLQLLQLGRLQVEALAQRPCDAPGAVAVPARIGVAHLDRQCQRLHRAGDVAEVGGGIEAHGVATWDGTWDRVAESRKAGKAVVLMGTASPAALSPH